MVILAITFILAAVFVVVPPHLSHRAKRQGFIVPSGIIVLLKAAGSGGLVIVMATGLLGANSIYTNLSMTLFWAVFLVGLTYISALAGDIFVIMNPWRLLLETGARLNPALLKPQVQTLQRWGYYPALTLFMAFTWIELFVRTRPFSLALLLLSYSAICFAGARLFGVRAWLQFGEFFGVYFRLISKIAPLKWVQGEGASVAIQPRAPLTGLVKAPPERFSLVVFVAFMVSSMIYHSARETLPWVRFFWQDIHGMVMPWAGTDPMAVRLFFERLQLIYESFALVASPAILLALILAALWGFRFLAKIDTSMSALARQFAYSLLPIALAYHACHYFTLLVTQGTQTLRLISDPFGFGWNLFGSSHLLQDPLLVDPFVVWHAQVAIMVLGHLCGIVVAHWQCLPMVESRVRLAACQLPLLLLTLLLTTNGLFLLSQPLSSGHSSHLQRSNP